MREDESGHLWVAALGSPSGLLRVDTDTATFIEFIGNAVLPGVDTPTGASVDVQGQVWLKGMPHRACPIGQLSAAAARDT